MADLIKRDDALKIVEEYECLYDNILALPADRLRLHARESPRSPKRVGHPHWTSPPGPAGRAWAALARS